MPKLKPTRTLCPLSASLVLRPPSFSHGTVRVNEGRYIPVCYCRVHVECISLSSLQIIFQLQDDCYQDNVFQAVVLDLCQPFVHDTQWMRDVIIFHADCT